jgi:hypothetical protein
MRLTYLVLGFSVKSLLQRYGTAELMKVSRALGASLCSIKKGELFYDNAPNTEGWQSDASSDGIFPSALLPVTVVRTRLDLGPNGYDLGMFGVGGLPPHAGRGSGLGDVGVGWPRFS